MKSHHCNKRVDNRNGQGANATRFCSSKVSWVDPLGRGWCKRHEPDDERKAVAIRNAEIHKARSEGK